MTDALIEVSEISHSFHGRGLVFDDLNFRLHPEDRVALVGENGAGKTTFLHLLVGLLKPQTGHISAFGKLRQSESDFVEVRAKSGLLFQDPDDQLFCPTVLEDVAFGPLNLGVKRDEAIQIALETLEDLGMKGFEDRITHLLSGGEKRMITLASVLAMKPEVLLLDEPSNALDNKARAHMINTLQLLPQAMIIISHDSDFLSQLANRWLKLDRGKLIEVDRPSRAL